MMAHLDNQIKAFINDVETFIVVTLKSVALSPPVKTLQSSLIKSLEKLKEKYPSLHKEDDLYAEAGDMYYECFVAVPTGNVISATDLKDVDKAGILKKKDKKKLKKWCVIKLGVFYTFDKQNSKSHSDAFALRGYQAKNSSSSKKEFSLTGRDNNSQVYGAPSEAERNSWVNAINSAARQSMSERTRSVVEDAKYSTAGTDVAYDDQDVAYENTEEASRLYDEATPVAPSIPTGQGPRVVSELIYDEAASRPMENTDDDIYEDTETPSPDEHSGTSKASARSSNSYDGYARAPNIPPKNFQDVIPYESMYYGLWDCSAENETELTFKRGDVLQVIGLEYDSYSWLTCELNGQVGLVPKDYLSPAYARA